MAHIYIIDDDPDIAEAMALILELDGYGVTLASDGQSALDLLSTCATLPDALVVDLYMPYMNGDMMLTHLWELRPETRALPVVLCTADARLPDAIAGLTPHVLYKPFEIDELWDIVEQACGAEVPAQNVQTSVCTT